MLRVLLFLSALVFAVSLYGQQTTDSESGTGDLAASEKPEMDTAMAVDYLSRLIRADQVWSEQGDTLRLSLERLIGHYREPFDSVERRLRLYPRDSLFFEEVSMAVKDTFPVRWLSDSLFIIDTLRLDRDPLVVRQTIVRNFVQEYTLDTLTYDPEGGEADSLLTPDMNRRTNARKKDTLKNEPAVVLRKLDPVLSSVDTLSEVIIDTAYLNSRNVILHYVQDRKILPPMITGDSRETARFTPDGRSMVFTDSIRVIRAKGDSPFYLVDNEKVPDSLRAAVQTLLTYTMQRDSILLHISDIYGERTPIWLTSNRGDLRRFWVKNYKNDSITLWLGNPGRKQLSLTLEDNITVDRVERETVEDIPITTVEPMISLEKLEPLEMIQSQWFYDFSSSLGLNQTYLANWAKGGESSLSTLLDVHGNANYENTASKLKWNNGARLKYGSIITEENGLRTNTDQLEINSQLNKELRKKLDFSAVFYTKHQIAKGYKKPSDEIPVSKFLNPGTFTVGLGFEYKPFKKTSINYSLLSYKNTFVLDTTEIDPTNHGIEAGRRFLQEMGGQMVVKNAVSVLDGLTIKNQVRLFSNYLNKPQNIDVDWEINLEKRVNWFFTVLLNMHFIYDDDVRFEVLNDNDEPVMLPDGSVKKVPKLQFKQFMGLTFMFKF